MFAIKANQADILVKLQLFIDGLYALHSTSV